MRLFYLLMVAGSWFGIAQINISSDATIQLVDAGTDCDGSMRLVDVYVDTSNCVAASGDDVGLNGFRLDFRLGAGTTPLYVYTRPGNSPISFSVVSSDLSLVAISEQVILIGWCATPNAPQGPYHVATLCFSGGTTPLTFDFFFYHPLSSLASCVSNGAGPGLIDISSASVTGSFTIDSNFSMSLLPGVPSWHQDDPIYDLVEPFGSIDILDYTKIATCTH